METIIVATDLSKASATASNYAAALAAEVNAQLIFIHVIENYNIPTKPPVADERPAVLETEPFLELERLKVQLSLYTSNRIQILTKIKHGIPEAVLSDLCKELNPFVLVLAAKYAVVGESAIPGDANLRIIRNIRFPGVIVPERAVFAGIKNIAIASNLEQVPEESVFLPVRRWLGLFHAAPDILHVCTDEESIHNTETADGIFDFIEQKKADLLVIAAGNYGFFKTLLHASIFMRLVPGSYLPVLVLQSHHLPANQEEIALNNHSHTGCAGCNGLCCKNKK